MQLKRIGIILLRKSWVETSKAKARYSLVRKHLCVSILKLYLNSRFLPKQKQQTKEKNAWHSAGYWHHRVGNLKSVLGHLPATGPMSIMLDSQSPDKWLEPATKALAEILTILLSSILPMKSKRLEIDSKKRCRLIKHLYSFQCV